MSQFLGQRLLAAPYFKASYLHGGTADLSAPSGMRRLMLYQLQEDYLKSLETKKDEQVKGQEAPSRESEAPEAKPVAAPTKRPRRAPRQRPPEPTTHEFRPIVLRPVVDQPTVYEALASLPPLVFNLYSETILRSAVIIDLKTEKRRRNRRRAAAFLLLAA